MAEEKKGPRANIRCLNSWRKKKRRKSKRAEGGEKLYEK